MLVNYYLEDCYIVSKMKTEKKGVVRVKTADGEFINIEKVYLKNLNKDFGFTEDIIKKLGKAKLIPTIYDWDSGKSPYFAKHEILELIEKLVGGSLDLMESIEEYVVKLEKANKVIELINNSSEEVKSIFRDILND